MTRLGWRAAVSFTAVLTLSLVAAVAPASSQGLSEEDKDAREGTWDIMDADGKWTVIVAAMKKRPNDPFYHQKLEELANSGYPEAQYMMAIRAADPKKAHTWFLKTARSEPSKHPKCWVLRGSCTRASIQAAENYYFGEGAAVNKSEAFKWFLKAGTVGDLDAAFNVAGMYRGGDGVKKSPKRAHEWYFKLADADGWGILGCIFPDDVCTRAAYEVGQNYYYGDGVAVNMSESFKWFLVAANAGNLDAAFAVALAYGNGDGVDEDREQYSTWLGVAAEGGHEEAIDLQGMQGALKAIEWAIENEKKKAGGKH